MRAKLFFSTARLRKLYVSRMTVLPSLSSFSSCLPVVTLGFQRHRIVVTPLYQKEKIKQLKQTKQRSFSFVFLRVSFDSPNSCAASLHQKLCRSFQVVGTALVILLVRSPARWFKKAGGNVKPEENAKKKKTCLYSLLTFLDSVSQDLDVS